MAYDEEQRAKKGKAKIVFEEEEKAKTFVHFENLNIASTSSSFNKFPSTDSETLNPQSPNSQTCSPLRVILRGMNGVEDLKLIFDKTLSATDVNSCHSRLLMPFNKLIRNDFLTSVEATLVHDQIGVRVILVDQRSEKWEVVLKGWELKRSWNYSLTCGWNGVVKANGLKKGDTISVWSFRWCETLCFALVPLPLAMGT